MRKNLKNINDIRDVFTGVFERYGTKNGFKTIEKWSFRTLVSLEMS